MFSYQKNFTNPTLPVDEAQFYALVRATQWNENIDRYRETGEASLKRKLPAFIFQAMFDETTSKTGKTGRWRKQSATRLTGLVVMDIDHVESEELRVKCEEFAAADFPQRAQELGILLIYITPSGHGLKIVFKARTEWGNLIDNQHAMAKLLGVEVDESCKDASRMSFICKESDSYLLTRNYLRMRTRNSVSDILLYIETVIHRLRKRVSQARMTRPFIRTRLKQRLSRESSVIRAKL